jgi:hypothetical protein
VNHRLRQRTWLAEALIIAALVLLPLLFWWRLWALDPANRAVIQQGDFTDQYFPLQLFAARELAAGRLPAWDPYINAGQPGLADIQTGFYYPFNLLPNLVLAATGAPFTIGLLTAQVVLHFSLASLFTYLLVWHLARRAGARIAAARFAGAVAALTFTYAGYLTSFPVQQLTILETAIWLPLVLFFVDRSFHQARSLPQILMAGMALGCALLAGHPQTAMYVVYAVLAYGLYLSCISGAGERARRISGCISRFAYHTLLPLTLAAALAAIQLVPTLGFIVRSTRAGLDYEAVAWGFPLAEMIQLLYPGYYGGSPQYVGILSAVLALAALFVVRARREVVFWIGLGLLALLLSLGGNTFLYRVAYWLVPGFGSVRNQERIIYLFSFATSVLAGYGALVLVQPLVRPVRKGFRGFVRGLAWAGVVFLAMTALWYLGYVQSLQRAVEVNLFEGVLRHHMLLLLVLGGGVVLFALRLSGKARRGWLIVLALGLIWLNLFTVNWQFNLAEPANSEASASMIEGPFPETGLVTFLKDLPGAFRISSAGLLPGGASAGIVYELEDITGNTPLRLEAFQQFEDRVGSWRRWQLLNVEYVLSDQEIDGPGLERVYEEEMVKVYRVGDPLPRAWLVHGTVIADDEQAFSLLDAEDFDPRAMAVLPPDSANLALSGLGGSGGGARIVEVGPGRLVLEVSPAKDSLLVISQPFYPGWRANVDSERAPIYRVDYMLQGVSVPAGAQRVALSYHLSPLPAAVSLVALLGCAIGLILCLWHREGPGKGYRSAGL